MEDIASSITDLIGRTPLLRLQSNSAELLAKLEFLNPGGSVKDRAALAIVEDAERRNPVSYTHLTLPTIYSV